VRAPGAVALDDYLAWVGAAYYTATEAGASCRDWALLRRTTLGRLCAPARAPAPFDEWAPLEVAKFEAALCVHGKNFPLVASLVGTKSVAKVVEFYYHWKQSKVRHQGAISARRRRARGRHLTLPPRTPLPSELRDVEGRLPPVAGHGGRGVRERENGPI